MRCICCNGSGRIQVVKGDVVEINRILWQQAEDISASKDGYHWIICQECQGFGDTKNPSPCDKCGGTGLL